MNTSKHTGYPHKAGTLYDCPACENGECQHAYGEGEEWCVAKQHDRWQDLSERMARQEEAEDRWQDLSERMARQEEER